MSKPGKERQSVRGPECVMAIIQTSESSPESGACVNQIPRRGPL